LKASGGRLSSPGAPRRLEWSRMMVIIGNVVVGVLTLSLFAATVRVLKP
jgi:hypothetical protein